LSSARAPYHMVDFKVNNRRDGYHILLDDIFRRLFCTLSRTPIILTGCAPLQGGIRAFAEASPVLIDGDLPPPPSPPPVASSIHSFRSSATGSRRSVICCSPLHTITLATTFQRVTPTSPPDTPPGPMPPFMSTGCAPLCCLLRTSSGEQFTLLS
jgi:hypothetical protein